MSAKMERMDALLGEDDKPTLSKQVKEVEDEFDIQLDSHTVQIMAARLVT